MGQVSANYLFLGKLHSWRLYFSYFVKFKYRIWFQLGYFVTIIHFFTWNRKILFDIQLLLNSSKYMYQTTKYVTNVIKVLYLALEEQVVRLPSVLSIAGHNGCLL